MREEIRAINEKAEKEKTVAKKEYVKNTTEVQDKFKDQSKTYKENICIIRD